MARRIAVFLLLGSGCASGPAGPTLPVPLRFTLRDYEESGNLFPIVGSLELTIDTEGTATSVCRRAILTDVKRRGDLTAEQRAEVATRVDAWAAKAEEPKTPAGRHFGSMVYGTKRATWEKEDVLPPELAALVAYLKTISPTLREFKSHP